MDDQSSAETDAKNPNSKQDIDSQAAEFLPPPPSNGNNTRTSTSSSSSSSTAETTKADPPEDSKMELATASENDGQVKASDATEVAPTRTDENVPMQEGVTEPSSPENSAAQQSLANDIATDVLANFHSTESQSVTQPQEQQEEPLKETNAQPDENPSQGTAGEAASAQSASGAEMPSLDNGISPSLLYGNANAAQSPYNPSYHAPAPTTGSFPSPYNYSPNQKPMVPHPRPYSAIVAGTSPNHAAKQVQVENGNGNPPEAQNNQNNGGAPSPSNDNPPLKRPVDDTGGADSFAPPSSVKRQRPNTDSTVIAPANIIPSNTPQPTGHVNGPAPPNGQTQPVGQVPANQPPQGMPPHMYHQFHNWNMFNFPQMGRPQGAPPGGDFAQYPPPPPLQPGAQSRSGSVPLTNGTQRPIAGVPPRNGPVPVASPTGCYSRKEKALGLLAQKLIALYECQQPPSGNSNMMQVLSIDQTASKLGVERRRIYDIINILEALDVVTKKGKNMYWWHGLGKIQETFMKMQREAIQSEEFRADAEKNGMTIGQPSVQQVSVTEEAKNEDVNPDDTNTQNLTATNTEDSPAQGLPPFSAALLDKEEPPAKTETPNQVSPAANAYSAALLEKGKGRTVRRCSFGSLGTLSKKFLQLYLIGYDALSLGEATERLLVQMGSMKKDDMNTDPTVSKTHRKRDEEVKGWKTKVRRLYDIANVLVSIGIIDKTTTPSHNKILANNGKPVQMHKNNQYFCWRYSLSPSQILDMNKEKGAMSTEDKPQAQENYLNWPEIKGNDKGVNL